MAENSPYFEAIVSARSVQLDAETALAGNTMLSAETCAEFGSGDSILPYVESNFEGFLKDLRHLSKEDQELLLAYYVLRKTQTQVAPLHGSTQTLTSSRIRLALKKFALFKIIGRPTAAAIRRILTHNKLEHILPHPMSEIIELYDATRSFDRVAMHFRLHRPTVRRAIREAANKLLGAKDALSIALGAHVFDLIDKASPTGRGASNRESRKQVDGMYVRTSKVFGEFRVDVTDPGFSEMFASQAVL